MILLDMHESNDLKNEVLLFVCLTYDEDKQINTFELLIRCNPDLT